MQISSTVDLAVPTTAVLSEHLQIVTLCVHPEVGYANIAATELMQAKEKMQTTVNRLKRVQKQGEEIKMMQLPAAQIAANAKSQTLLQQAIAVKPAPSLFPTHFFAQGPRYLGALLASQLCRLQESRPFYGRGPSGNPTDR